MVQIIKEVGIFIVIAQAVLYFVPGESYVKYVKIIIGIIMIAQMAQPLLLLVSEGAWEQILEQSLDIRELPALGAAQAEDGKSRVGQNLERELAMRLNEQSAEGYIVRRVEIREEEECAGITVSVSRQEQTDGKIRIENITVGEKEADDGEKQMLREPFAQALGMKAEDVEVEILE